MNKQFTKFKTAILCNCINKMTMKITQMFQPQMFDCIVDIYTHSYAYNELKRRYFMITTINATKNHIGIKTTQSNAKLMTPPFGPNEIDGLLVPPGKALYTLLTDHLITG